MKVQRSGAERAKTGPRSGIFPSRFLHICRRLIGNTFMHGGAWWQAWGLLWKCCTAAMVNASSLAMNHGYRATKPVWVSRPIGRITNTSGDCGRAKPGAIDFHRVAGATSKDTWGYYERGCCKSRWIIYRSSSSVFMPENRKAGSEEPAIRGIIRYAK